MADVDSLEISFQNILVAEVRSTYGSFALSKFSVEEVFGDTAIMHAANVTSSAKTTGSEECKDAW